MTKSELVKNLCVKFPHLKEKEVEALIALIFQEISVSLSMGDRVELRGFGAFSLRNRSARLARNPRTGEQVKVDDRNSIYYRAGKALREYLND
jgi:integration host factor subunit beta